MYICMSRAYSTIVLRVAACLSYQYDCDGTGYECVPDYDVCDGTEDCYNGSDEDNCRKYAVAISPPLCMT